MRSLNDRVSNRWDIREFETNDFRHQAKKDFSSNPLLTFFRQLAHIKLTSRDSFFLSAFTSCNRHSTLLDWVWPLTLWCHHTILFLNTYPLLLWLISNAPMPHLPGHTLPHDFLSPRLSCTEPYRRPGISCKVKTVKERLQEIQRRLVSDPFHLQRCCVLGKSEEASGTVV